MNGISDEFQKPIRPIDVEEQNRLRVPPIERDKKIKEDGSGYQNMDGRKKKSLLLTPFLFLLNKFLKFTGKTNEEKQRVALNIDQLGADVLEIRDILHLLKDQDQSENAQFSQCFSEVWHRMTEYCDLVISFREETAINLDALEKFIDSVKNYPPNEEHSLGFYLSEYAGKDWLPFPFMEILKKVHTDFIVNREDSYLERWTTYLTHSLKL